MLTIIRDWLSEDKDAAELKDIDDIRRRLYVLIYHAVYVGKSSNKAHLNTTYLTNNREDLARHSGQLPFSLPPNAASAHAMHTSFRLALITERAGK